MDFTWMPCSFRPSSTCRTWGMIWCCVYRPSCSATHPRSNRRLICLHHPVNFKLKGSDYLVKHNNVNIFARIWFFIQSALTAVVRMFHKNSALLNKNFVIQKKKKMSKVKKLLTSQVIILGTYCTTWSSGSSLLPPWG